MLRDLRDHVHSAEFADAARGPDDAGAFTCRRKLPLPTLIAALLCQRCQEHKRRNVLDHLPKTMHASVNRALRDAWAASDADLARRQLQRLANSLTSKHPGAAASLREGLEDTLTLQTLGITGSLYRTLRTTNPIKNLNGLVATYTRNVKRWSDGAMVLLRWVASALNDAAPRMRRLRGCDQMKTLLQALMQRFPRDTVEATRQAALHPHQGTVTSARFNSERAIAQKVPLQ